MGYNQELIEIIVTGRNNFDKTVGEVTKQARELAKEFGGAEKATEKLSKSQERLNKNAKENNSIYNVMLSHLAKLHTLQEKGLKLTEEQAAAAKRMGDNIRLAQEYMNGHTKSVDESNKKIEEQNALFKEGEKVMNEMGDAYEGMTQRMDRGARKNIKRFEQLNDKLREAGYETSVLSDNMDKLVSSKHDKRLIDVAKSYDAITNSIKKLNQERANSKYYQEEYERLAPSAMFRKDGWNKRPEQSADIMGINAMQKSMDDLDARLPRIRKGLKDSSDHVRTMGENWQRFVHKLGGGKESDFEKDTNQMFRNLRGLTSELRGFSIAFVLKNIQGLTSAATGLVGELISVAGSAIGAGAALGGALASGAAQAIGPMTLLFSTIGRLVAVFNVLDLKKQIEEASNHTREANKAGKATDTLRNAQERLADAHRAVTKAQRDLNEARREARRDLIDLNNEEARSNLNLEEARRALESANQSGDTAAIANAQLDLAEARNTAKRSTADNIRAKRGGVNGMPGVVSARERLSDANRQAAQATRALANAENELAAAGTGATASQDRLNYLLEQLSPVERDLVKSIEKLKDVYAKNFRPITDIIVESISEGVDAGTDILNNKGMLNAFKVNALEAASAMRRLTGFFSSDQTLGFAKFFTEASAGKISGFTTIFINLAKAFMNIGKYGLPIFDSLVKNAEKLSEKILDSTRGSKEMSEFFADSQRDLNAWIGLLGSIWNLFTDIFDPARDQGTKTIQRWTTMINNFADSLHNNESGVRKFFADSSEAAHQVLRVVWELGKALVEIFNPASVRDLADFLILIVIPAFKTAITTIGLFTRMIQVVLSQDVISTFARWVLSVALLTRTVLILQTAMKGVAGTVAAFLTLFGTGGKLGLAGSLRVVLAVFILITSALAALGIKLDGVGDAVRRLTNFFREHQTVAYALSLTLGALAGRYAALHAAMAVDKIIAWTKAMRAAAVAGAAMDIGSILAMRGRGGVKGIPGGPNSSTTSATGGIKDGFMYTGGMLAGSLVSKVKPAAKALGTGIASRAGIFAATVRAGNMGAALGSVAPGVGTAVGLLAGAAVGAGAAYLLLRKRQDEYVRSATIAEGATRRQITALRDLKYAKLDSENAGLDVKQANIDIRSAKKRQNEVLANLMAPKSEGGMGMSKSEALKSDEYSQTKIDIERAYAARTAAARRARSETIKLKKEQNEAATSIREENKKLAKGLEGTAENIAKYGKEYRKYSKLAKDARGAGLLEDANNYERKAAKAQDRYNESLNDYRRLLGKLPEAYRNTKKGNKELGDSFGDLGLSSLNAMKALTKDVNGVLAAFDVDPIKFSLRKDTSQDSGGAGVKGAMATGGYVGRPGQRGPDNRLYKLGDGEAVVNSVHQRYINPALEMLYGTNLPGLFSKTKGAIHGMASGGYAGMTPGIKNAASAILDRFPGLSLKSGRRNWGGTSYHERGMAADIGGSAELMRRAAAWIKSSMGSKLAEGIHNPNLSIKNGKNVPASFWGGTTWANHANHIHIAVAGALGKITGGAATQIAKMKFVGGNTPGHKILNAAISRVRKAANKYIEKELGSLSDSDPAISTSSTANSSAAENQRIGRKMMLKMGFGTGQWPALKALWEGESNWLPKTNPSSGAYGIPQALPSAHGYPYSIKDIPAQIRWGLNYIKERYGTPSAALKAWQGRSPHWYASGGIIPGAMGLAKPIMAHAGEMILNTVQQNKLFRLLNNSNTGSIINPNYSGFSGAMNQAVRNVGSGKTKKAEAALRALTDEDGGYFAMFTEAISKFAEKLGQGLKRASFAFIGGKATKTLTDLQVLVKTGENIAAQADELGKMISKVKASYRRSGKLQRIQRESRDDIDEDLGDLYDRRDNLAADGKSTSAITKRIAAAEKRRGKTKAGKKRLAKFKAAQKKLSTTKAGRKKLREMALAMEAEEADLAQQAYDNELAIADNLDATSNNKLSAENRKADYLSAATVGGFSAANATKIAALTARNASLPEIIAKYRALGENDKADALEQEMKENTLAIKNNTTAQMDNTFELHSAFASFKSGVISGGINIIKSLGSLLGNTDISLIKKLLGIEGSNLTAERTSTIGDLNGLLSRKGMSPIGNLSGSALVTKLVELMSVSTTGWTPGEEVLWRKLINSLIQNEAAIINNTEELKNLTGNNTQGFSSTSWTSLRQAVFNGANGLLPQFAALAPAMGIPLSAITPTSSSVINTQSSNDYSGHQNRSNNVEVNVTKRLEVVEPEEIGKRVMFELNNGGR